MSHYLLSVHTATSDEDCPPPAPGDPEVFMGRVRALEADMRASHTFVLQRRLHDADTATVVRPGAPNWS